MTTRVEFHEINREHMMLAIQLAEHVVLKLQTAEADPFVAVAVAALLVGGYATCASTTIGSVTSAVGELAEHFDSELQP